MAYTPNDLPNYIAAYSGALAGMAASGRYPVDNDPTSPANVAMGNAAGAYAQALDTFLGTFSGSNGGLTTSMIQTISLGVWANRASEASGDVADYTLMVQRFLGTIEVALIYFGTQGIPDSINIACRQFFATKVAAPAFPVLNGGDPQQVIASLVFQAKGNKVLLQATVPYNSTGVSPGQGVILLSRSDSGILDAFVYKIPATGVPAENGNFVVTMVDDAPNNAASVQYDLAIVCNDAGAQLTSSGNAYFAATDYNQV